MKRNNRKTEDYTDKNICKKTRDALDSYVSYVQNKINMASEPENTVSDMELCECIRTLNHVSGILLRLKEYESENETKMVIHNSYVTNAM